MHAACQTGYQHKAAHILANTDPYACNNILLVSLHLQLLLQGILSIFKQYRQTLSLQLFYSNQDIYINVQHIAFVLDIHSLAKLLLCLKIQKSTHWVILHTNLTLVLNVIFGRHRKKHCISQLSKILFDSWYCGCVYKQGCYTRSSRTQALSGQSTQRSVWAGCS